MSGIESALANTLSRGKLADDPDHEAACDHIGALAWTDRLGALLWRYRLGGDKSCRRSAVLLLTKKVRKHGQSTDMIERICDRVMTEWMNPTCTRCRGKGAVESSTGVVSVCGQCLGSGLASASEQARVRATKMDLRVYHLKWKHTFATAHNILSECDGRVQRDLARGLERGRFRTE